MGDELVSDCQRIHQQSNERTRGWGSTGLSGLPENWTTALIPRSVDFGTHPTSAETGQRVFAWEGGRYKAARGAMREQGRSKTGIASLPHVKCAPMGALGPVGERQEHLDAIISFAGVGKRRRLFRGLDILTI